MGESESTDCTNNLGSHLWLQGTLGGRRRNKWTQIKGILVAQGIITRMDFYINHEATPTNSVLLMALRDYLREYHYGTESTIHSLSRSQRIKTCVEDAMAIEISRIYGTMLRFSWLNWII